MCSGKGGSVLVHVGRNNVEREVQLPYRQLVRTLNQKWVEQVIEQGFYH